MRFVKAVSLLALVTGASPCWAAPLSGTFTVKSVNMIFRPGVSFGIRIETVEPITGTTCAAADVSRGFYYSQPASLDIPQMQSFQNQALFAASQEKQITVSYDSATCTAGWGVTFREVKVDI